ncbi:MAG: SDR family NAD(P)-dependent oxidoreductase, partial [Pseudomonadota bacterium]|nr:SDR family NAD(P)-dependent oxidoreductase [Pseudomonadota bacterium]
MINKHLFCFGLGYSASFLANILVDKGWTISATTSSKIRYTNSTFNLFDFDKVPEGYLNSVSHILVSTPPISKGDPVLLRHSEALKTVPQLEWIAYLSSTGVYGN